MDVQAKQGTSLNQSPLGAILAGALVVLVAAMLPAVAQAEALNPHVVTPKQVSPHVATPPPASSSPAASSPTGSASPESTPEATSEATPEPTADSPQGADPTATDQTAADPTTTPPTSGPTADDFEPPPVKPITPVPQRPLPIFIPTDDNPETILGPFLCPFIGDTTRAYNQINFWFNVATAQQKVGNKSTDGIVNQFLGVYAEWSHAVASTDRWCFTTREQ